VLPFRCFVGQIPQTFCTLTQIVRAQQMARPAKPQFSGPPENRPFVWGFLPVSFLSAGLW
jgi:hypothetical protein